PRDYSSSNRPQRSCRNSPSQLSLTHPPAHLHAYTFPYTSRPPPGSTLSPYTTLFRSCSPSSTAPSPTTRRIRSNPRTSSTPHRQDRKSTRLNSSHVSISYAVFCLKKKKNEDHLKRHCNLITM